MGGYNEGLQSATSLPKSNRGGDFKFLYLHVLHWHERYACALAVCEPSLPTYNLPNYGMFHTNVRHLK